MMLEINGYLERIIGSFIVILILLIVYGIVIHFLEKRFLKQNQLDGSSKSLTFIHLAIGFIRFIVISIGVIIILDINGINVSSLLASFGIIGIVIGFAVQDALKDIVKGIDIIMEDYFKVGQVVTIENVTGIVKSISFKTTVIQDLKTNNLVSIANRRIQVVQSISDVLNIDVPMPYEKTLKENEKVIGQLVDECFKMEGVETSEYMGLENLSDSYLLFRLRFTCSPYEKGVVRRQILRTLIQVLEKNDIKVPYNQIVIHQ